MEKQTETIRTRISKTLLKALTKQAEEEFTTVSSLLRKVATNYIVSKKATNKKSI